MHPGQRDKRGRVRVLAGRTAYAAGEGLSGKLRGAGQPAGKSLSQC